MYVEITHQMTIEEEKEMYRDLYHEQEALNHKILNENSSLKKDIDRYKDIIDRLIGR